MLGGHPGACSRIVFDDGRTPHPKSRTLIEPGQRITLSYAGGGGVGDPRERARDAVREDLADGYISAETARDVYGLEP
jgi:N-methylhydantoinase B